MMEQSRQNKVLKISQLIDLSVYRDVYCDQETTDKALRHLCSARPDLVQELAEQEMRGLPDGRDALYGKKCGNIIHYFRQDAPQDELLDISRLGMLDLLYELSRRLRRVLGLLEIPVLGEPLVDAPNDKLPQIVQTKVWTSSTGKQPVSQEFADRALAEFFEKYPALVFEVSEQQRRLMRTYEINGECNMKLRGLLSKEEEAKWPYLLGELTTRIHHMCKIPSYEVLKAMFLI